VELQELLEPRAQVEHQDSQEPVGHLVLLGQQVRQVSLAQLGLQVNLGLQVTQELLVRRVALAVGGLQAPLALRDIQELAE
jgi:hypothetical protein